MSPARQAAFIILLRVERESAYAIELLHSPLLDRLPARDRNLTHEIVMGVLRWQSLLDSSFAHFLSTPFKKLDLEVWIALRMGAYQLAFLDRIPGHAIVHETVELIKKSKKRSAASLVNAVMRKLEPQRHSLRSGGKGPAHDYAHPSWLVQRWIAEFGHDTAEAICRYDQHVPRTVISLSSPADEVQLQAEGIQSASGSLVKDARVVTAGDVAKSKLFHAGRVAIQDEGSQLVAALVGKDKAKRILDCCAAPGGKTAALAMAHPQTEIFATDLHPHRTRLLRKIAPQPNVHVFTADAQHLPFAVTFDRILTDVPCSGTGTLARNPEIKWRLKPEDLHDLRARQLAILNSALKHLALEGRLIYSTCSLEREEDEQVIAGALNQNHEFEIVPVREELLRLKDIGILVWPDLDGLISGNFLRMFPGVHPCDGFFAAILQRATDKSGRQPR